MNANDNPLVGPAPTEVPLENPPLIRVIAQVRFGEILSIESMVPGFQEAIRGDYPTLRTENFNVEIRGSTEIVDRSTKKLWRFTDASGDWRVTLTSDFLALETTRYSSRKDLLRRLEFLLRRLEEHVKPRLITRLGVRFIDRVTGSVLEDLKTVVRPEVVGLIGSSVSTQVQHSICDSAFDLVEEKGRAIARWGRVPANATTDPSAIEPIEQDSWILDIDAFCDEPQPLEVATITDRARALSERIYAIFRWVVNAEFLKQFGGRV